MQNCTLYLSGNNLLVSNSFWTDYGIRSLLWNWLKEWNFVHCIAIILEIVFPSVILERIMLSKFSDLVFTLCLSDKIPTQKIKIRNSVRLSKANFPQEATFFILCHHFFLHSPLLPHNFWISISLLRLSFTPRESSNSCCFSATDWTQIQTWAGSTIYTAVM